MRYIYLGSIDIDSMWGYVCDIIGIIQGQWCILHMYRTPHYLPCIVLSMPPLLHIRQHHHYIYYLYGFLPNEWLFGIDLFFSDHWLYLISVALLMVLCIWMRNVISCICYLAYYIYAVLWIWDNMYCIGCWHGISIIVYSFIFYYFKWF